MLILIYNYLVCFLFNLVFHSRSQAKVSERNCIVFPLPITKLTKQTQVKKGSFFSFGRYEEYKNFNYIVELAKLMPQYSFYIASKGFNLKNIPSNLTLYSNYLPEKDLDVLIQQCQAVLLPYTSATQSGVIIKAFEASTPVIVSDLEGLKEYISNTNQLGSYFNLENPMSFHSAVKCINKIDHELLFEEVCCWNSSNVL